MPPKPMATRGGGKGKQEGLDSDPAHQQPGSLMHSLYVVFAESGKTPLSGREALSRIFEKRLMLPSNGGKMQERARKAHRNLELENEAIKRLRKSSYFFELTRGTFMLCSALEEAPDDGDNRKNSSVPQEVIDEQKSSFPSREAGRSRKRKSDSSLERDESTRNVDGRRSSYEPEKRPRPTVDDDSDCDFETMVLKQLPEYLPTPVARDPRLPNVNDSIQEESRKAVAEPPATLPVSTVPDVISGPSTADEERRTDAAKASVDVAAARGKQLTTLPLYNVVKPLGVRRRPGYPNWQAALSVRQAAFTKRHAAYTNRHAVRAADRQKEGSLDAQQRAGTSSEGRNSHRRLAAKLASLRLAQSLKPSELARIVHQRDGELPARGANHSLLRLCTSGEGQTVQQWTPTSTPWKDRRCSRKVKETWQCDREAAKDHKLCEHHLYINYYRKKFAGFKRGKAARREVKDECKPMEDEASGKRDSTNDDDGSASPQRLPPCFVQPKRPSEQLSAVTGKETDRGLSAGKQILVLPGSSLPRNLSDSSSDGEKLSGKDSAKDTAALQRMSISLKPPKDPSIRRPRPSLFQRGKQIMVLAGSDVQKDFEKEQSSRQDSGFQSDIGGIQNKGKSSQRLDTHSVINGLVSTHEPIPGSLIEKVLLRKQSQMLPSHLSSGTSASHQGGIAHSARDVKGSPSRTPPQPQQDTTTKSLYSFLLKYRLVKQQMKKAKANGADVSESDFTRTLPSNFQIGMRSEISKVTGLLDSAHARVAPTRPTQSVKVVEATKCRAVSAVSNEPLHSVRTHDYEGTGVQLVDNSADEKGLSNTSKELALTPEEVRKHSGRKRLHNGLHKLPGFQGLSRVSASSEEMPMSSDSDGSGFRNVRKCKHARKSFIPRSLEEQALNRQCRSAGNQNLSFPKGLMDYLRLKKGHGGPQACAVPKFPVDGDRKVKARLKNVGSVIAQCSNLSDAQQVIGGGSERKVQEEVPRSSEAKCLQESVPAINEVAAKQRNKNVQITGVVDKEQLAIVACVTEIEPAPVSKSDSMDLNMASDIQFAAMDVEPGEPQPSCSTPDKTGVSIKGTGEESSPCNLLCDTTELMDPVVGEKPATAQLGSHPAQESQPAVQSKLDDLSVKTAVNDAPGEELASSNVSAVTEDNDLTPEPGCDRQEGAALGSLAVDGRRGEKLPNLNEDKPTGGRARDVWFFRGKHPRDVEEFCARNATDVCDIPKSRENGAVVHDVQAPVAKCSENGHASPHTCEKSLWDLGKESGHGEEQVSSALVGSPLPRDGFLQGKRRKSLDLRPPWFQERQEGLSLPGESPVQYPMNVSNIQAAFRKGLQPHPTSAVTVTTQKLNGQGVEAGSLLNKMLPGKHMLQAQASGMQSNSSLLREYARAQVLSDLPYGVEAGGYGVKNGVNQSPLKPMGAIDKQGTAVSASPGLDIASRLKTPSRRLAEKDLTCSLISPPVVANGGAFNRDSGSLSLAGHPRLDSCGVSNGRSSAGYTYEGGLSMNDQRSIAWRNSAQEAECCGDRNSQGLPVSVAGFPQDGGHKFYDFGLGRKESDKPSGQKVGILQPKEVVVLEDEPPDLNQVAQQHSQQNGWPWNYASVSWSRETSSPNSKTAATAKESVAPPSRKDGPSLLARISLQAISDSNGGRKISFVPNTLAYKNSRPRVDRVTVAEEGADDDGEADLGLRLAGGSCTARPKTTRCCNSAAAT